MQRVKKNDYNNTVQTIITFQIVICSLAFCFSISSSGDCDENKTLHQRRKTRGMWNMQEKFIAKTDGR